MRAVVRREVVVDELVDLLRGADRRLHLGTAGDQNPIRTATPKNARAVPSHHRQARYATTGKATVQNRANSLHSGAWAPVTAERARATRLDSLPTRTESDDTERTIDR